MMKPKGEVWTLGETIQHTAWSFACTVCWFVVPMFCTEMIAAFFPSLPKWFLAGIALAWVAVTYVGGTKFSEDTLKG